MDSLDNLLAQLKAEYEEPTKPEQPKPKPPAAKPLIEPSAKSASLIDSLLEDVKADYEEHDRAEELRRQQQIEQEKIRQQILKAQKLEVLKKRAKNWLEKLDPFSSEGLWFESFAEKYPSKLEAAIEYLEGIEESQD